MDLKRAISNIKSLPIGLRELETLLPPRCATIQYKNLTQPRAKLFKNNDAYVVRIPNRGNKVGHFVVILAKRNHIEFFSPTGGSIASEFKRLGQDPALIQRLVGQHYIHNTKALQSNKASIQDCACWALARCYLKDLKLREFQGLFSKSVNLQSSDDIVSLMCLLLLGSR